MNLGGFMLKLISFSMVLLMAGTAQAREVHILSDLLGGKKNSQNCVQEYNVAVVGTQVEIHVLYLKNGQSRSAKVIEVGRHSPENLKIAENLRRFYVRTSQVSCVDPSPEAFYSPETTGSPSTN
jgi:hypothetical protein